jgi:hypothetical protein
MLPEESDPQTRLQAIRPLYSNNTTATAESDVVYVAIYLDPVGREIVFWEDVLVAFKNALNIRQNSSILPFLRGSDYMLYVWPVVRSFVLHR